MLGWWHVADSCENATTRCFRCFVYNQHGRRRTLQRIERQLSSETVARNQTFCFVSNLPRRQTRPGVSKNKFDDEDDDGGPRWSEPPAQWVLAYASRSMKTVFKEPLPPQPPPHGSADQQSTAFIHRLNSQQTSLVDLWPSVRVPVASLQNSGWRTTRNHFVSPSWPFVAAD